MKIRVLIADDHKMFRHALRLILNKEPNIEVVGEAGEGEELLALADEIKPDVVCMDISMPVIDGIEATRRLIAIRPEIKIIGLSAYTDQYYVMKLMDAGAMGYVTKQDSAEEVMRAIRTVHDSKKKYYCPDIAVNFMYAVSNGAEESAAAKLSARERQVLRLVAEGNSSSSISQSLFIASTTVEVHRRNIMRKLNLHSIADLTRYAIRHGITS